MDSVDQKDSPGDYGDTNYLIDRSGKKVPLSPAMIEKLNILRAFGFKNVDETIQATLLNLHPRNPSDKYRTKCFMKDSDRVRAHQLVISKARGGGTVKKTKDGRKLEIEVGDLDPVIYSPPVPLVPFPHTSKQVTPNGFERRSPNYAQKVLDRYS